MNFKKIVLSGLCVVSIGGLSLTQIDASILSNKLLKSNVVYTKTDASLHTKDTRSLEEVYKEQSLKVLKNHFGIEFKLDTNTPHEFYATLVNEETLKKEEQEERKILKLSLDKKEISIEEYNKYVSRLEERLKGQRERLDLLKHEMVECKLIYGKHELYNYDFYDIVFDANTKEVLDVACFPKNPDSSKKNNGELSKLGIDYIKKHNLGGLTNPEVVMTYGGKNNNLIYQEKGDTSKKVVLNFDSSTHQIFGFMTKNCAEKMYKELISEKSK